MSSIESCFPKRGEMVSIIQRHVQPVRRTEIVPFYLAGGCVCAEDIFSANILPNTPVSRFDGIAVRYDDFEKGPPDTSGWILGKEYEYSNTGIAMPNGYDTVIAIEDVRIWANGIEIHEQPEHRGEMVNAIGENMKAGEKLISHGEIITPGHVGLLAAGGIVEISVFSKPRVGIIPTGDELVAPTNQVPTGKNVESNSYMIAAYLAGWGAEPTRYPIVRDEPTSITAAIEKAMAENDAAIIIAGSSLGTKDYTIRVLREMGAVIVPELAHGPGRKSSFSMVDTKPVLGIAGPPLGAQITCDLYLAPFVSALRGIPYVKLQKLTVISDDAYRVHEVDFCERAHIYRAADGYHIRSAFAPKSTRAQMQAMANGNFYRVAGTSCRPGEQTVVELLCPIEFIPDYDKLPDILREDVQTCE